MTAKTDLVLKPLGDRVLVERDEAEEKTGGGIFLPDRAREKPTQGSVVSVGEGILTKEGKRSPLAVKPGNRVLFSRYSGDEIEIGGQKLLLIREEDILAVIHEKS